MSHYFAQEMFSKVLVSPTLPSPYNTLKVSIVSDHLEPLEVELMVKIQRWDELENHYRGHPLKASECFRGEAGLKFQCCEILEGRFR